MVARKNGFLYVGRVLTLPINELYSDEKVYLSCESRGVIIYNILISRRLSRARYQLVLDGFSGETLDAYLFKLYKQQLPAFYGRNYEYL